MPEDVEIVDYDPRWPARFTEEASRVRRLLAEPSVAVRSIELAERYAAVLVQNGYEEVDRRRDSGVWERLVAFRAYLRRHPEVAAEYAALKRSLAGTVGHDRHRYMTAKGDFIDRISAVALRESGVW